MKIRILINHHYSKAITALAIKLCDPQIIFHNLMVFKLLR